MEVGAKVWIPDPEDLWKCGTIQQRQDHQVVVVFNSTKTTVSLDAGKAKKAQIFLKNDDSDEDLTQSHDLISLQHLHEPALLYALCTRYQKDMIYTYIGNILLAFNPFKRLDYLYTNEVANMYNKATPLEKSKLKPHAFAIASNAYKDMSVNKKNQSILVSGESGAGKTETTKIVMQYLAVVGSKAPPLSSIETVSISQQVLQTNPILEAFGNAKTIRNDNSSRFGKFVEIQFCNDNSSAEFGNVCIVGAKIRTFLLEKVRLVRPAFGERNFHIFYELLAGISDDLKLNWNLTKPNDYNFLNNSTSNNGYNFKRMDGVDDKEQFLKTVGALNDVGMDANLQERIFAIVASLLHLGNVAFDSIHEHDEDFGARVSPATRSHFDKASFLLGVSVDKLESSFVTRNIRAGKSEFLSVKRNAAQARDACHALCRAIYGGLFNWLVSFLSDRMDAQSSCETIGILDIFGFENLNDNGLEQLCINYANESLQRQFNSFVFSKEQVLYEEEDIDWSYIAFPDNNPIIDLFEAKPIGILSLLDQEGILPGGSNQGLASKLYSYHCVTEIGKTSLSKNPERKRLESKESIEEELANSKEPTQNRSSFTSVMLLKKKHKRKLRRRSSNDDDRKQKTKSVFEASSIQRANTEFVIHHFAGKVCYRIDSFLEKNQEILPTEAMKLLCSSSCDILKGIPKSPSAVNPPSSNKPASLSRQRSASSIRTKSVTAQFRSQLSDLLAVIDSTSAHYIRCIKPNDKAKPSLLNRKRVGMQLRSGGVLEAVRIARAGYSIRMPLMKFIGDFGFLANAFLWRNNFKSLKNDLNCVLKQSELTAAAIVVHMMKLNKEKINFMTMKLSAADAGDVCFMGVQSAAQNLLSFANKNTNPTDLVRDCEKYSEMRKSFKRELAQCIGFQIGRTRVFFRKESFALLEEWRFEERSDAAVEIQSLFRQRLQRKTYLRSLKNITICQAIGRGYIARRSYSMEIKKKKEIEACILIQSICRTFLTRKDYLHQVSLLQQMQRLKEEEQCNKEALLSLNLTLVNGPSDTVKNLSPSMEPLYESAESEEETDTSDPCEQDVNLVEYLKSENEALKQSLANMEQQFQRRSSIKDSFCSTSQRAFERELAIRTIRHPPRSAYEISYDNDHDDDSPRVSSTASIAVESLIPWSLSVNLPNDLTIIHEQINMVSKKILSMQIRYSNLKLIDDERLREMHENDLLDVKGDSGLYDATIEGSVNLPYSKDLKQSQDLLLHLLNKLEFLRDRFNAELIEKKKKLRRKSYQSTRSSDYSYDDGSCRNPSMIPSSNFTMELKMSAMQRDVALLRESVMENSSYSKRAQSNLLPSPLVTESHLIPYSEKSEKNKYTTPIPFDRGCDSITVARWSRDMKCLDCGDHFSIFVRRHHCRACGNSFCHEHSSRKHMLPELGYGDEYVRVCDSCFISIRLHKSHFEKM